MHGGVCEHADIQELVSVLKTSMLTTKSLITTRNVCAESFSELCYTSVSVVMGKKILFELRSWSHSFIVLALTAAIVSFLSEQQFVGAQSTTVGGDTAAQTNPPNPAVTVPAVTVPVVVPGGSAVPPLTYLGDMCMTSTSCSAQVANSECADSGENTGAMRCRCSTNFYAFNDKYSSKKEDSKCGKVLTTAININCQACEDNEGTCVEDSAQTNGIFCECEISRSGVNCEIVHVNVSCSMAAMRICYSPHPNVDFANGWEMFTSAHQRTPQCGSTTVNQTNPTCHEGNQELVLSLNQSDLVICGTTSIDDAHNRRYMNKIEVLQFDSSGKSVDNATEISFNVYCSFTAYQDQTFQGIGVGRVNGNDQGTQVNPNVTFKVTDSFGRPIGNGVTLRVGDMVRFTITLYLDGNYGSLQIMRATASTSPVMPDSRAETRALMTGGCPVPGEVTGDSWYWTPMQTGNQLDVTSGSVPIFKLASSNDLFIHCALKLCMTGDNSCPIYTKSDCQPGSARRKRDVELEIVEVRQHGNRRRRAATTNADVQTQLRVVDPNANPQADPLSVGSPGFIALLIILGVIAFVLIVVTIIVAVKTRRKSVNDQNYQPRPQLFALPRISRTHERF